MMKELPADLPLPGSPPLQEKWLRHANILQPYGHSAFIALTDIKDRPEWLKKEFGFNAIIVQPPDSHNTIAAPADELSEQQFRDRQDVGLCLSNDSSRRGGAVASAFGP